VETGQPVVIMAEAVNTGWSAGERVLTLKASGSTQEVTTVKLAPGQRRDLSFQITPTEPGEYVVSIGDVTGKLTVVGASVNVKAAGKGSTPFPGIQARPEAWWSMVAAAAALTLACVLLLIKIKSPSLVAADSSPTSSPGETVLRSQAPEVLLAPVRTQVTSRLRKPVVETITGPTRRLKTPGPYTFEIKVVGGKPPYTIEWRGDSITRRTTDSDHVELLREQTWDSGKGNWVFVMVRDSAGKYAEWVDEEGKTKRLFTYGITRKGKVVTSPPRFPYDFPHGEPRSA